MQQHSLSNLSKSSTATHSSHTLIADIPFPIVLQGLLIVFAYAWWAVIIVYYGLLDGSISLGYQFQSFPIVIVSLALVHILKLTLQKDRHLLSTLVGVGLFVSGLLA